MKFTFIYILLYGKHTKWKCEVKFTLNNHKIIILIDKLSYLWVVYFTKSLTDMSKYSIKNQLNLMYNLLIRISL